MTMGTVGKWPAALVLYFMCIELCYPTLAFNITHISAKGEIGEAANVTCHVTPETVNIKWYFQNNPVTFDERRTLIVSEDVLPGKDMDGNLNRTKISTIRIVNATADDAVNYTCVATLGENKIDMSTILNMSFPVKLINITEGRLEANATGHQTIEMKCVFEVYKLEEVKWQKLKMQETDSDETNGVTTKHTRISPRLVESIHQLNVSGTQDNGTYVCSVEDPETLTSDSGRIDLFVYAKPVINIKEVIAISTTQIFVNWTVQPFNAAIRKYEVQYSKSGEGAFISHNKQIPVENTSCVVGNLEKSTKYKLRVTVGTDYGNTSSDSLKEVATLDKEPVFVPMISINGFSATSVTIGWTAPPENIAHLIHYYVLQAKKKNETTSRTAYHQRDNRNLPYMFDNLEPHTTYVFQVCACSEYTKTCGEWSMEIKAATLDGIPGKPIDVVAHCEVSHLNVTWGPPLKRNAEIKGYAMELRGVANYTDRNGNLKTDSWGPFSKFMANDSSSVRVDELQPYTLYTVSLSAVTRTRRRGEEETTHCITKPAPPDTPPRPRWRKVLVNGTFLFKTYLPRISERNGPICCYRVYVVRLPPNKDFKHLPRYPKEIGVIDYEASSSTFGAYVADILTSKNYPKNGEIVIGDGHTIFNKQYPSLNSADCERCLEGPKHAPITTTVTTTTVTLPTTTADYIEDGYTDEPATINPDHNQVKRNAPSDYGKDLTMADSSRRSKEDTKVKVVDGALDPNSFYTLFVELIPGQSKDEPMFSEYLNMLMPAASPPPPPLPSSPIEIALQATCAVAAVVLVGMVAYCVLQARRGHKLPPHAHELSSLHTVFRCIAGKRRRQQIVSTLPRDLPPIAKEDLADAYMERSANSDYKFQEEFEWLQMLPECYADRTTHASEARENQPKNRYPDIKAYDQTRVKLSQIDGISGSDYINANYVMGYKEAKQFICAQGPTDATVNDFWRMVWEQGLELIVMLTNLEEYSKVKCSKYWPDDRASRTFGTVNVQHHQEKRYSDYIVRELRITKQPTNADGQPIVENNGIAKRNGDCKEGSESSVPTSPREVKEGEVRLVRQFHFLMWKDFAAPDHAHSILKFIKRVNEAWSLVVGRPVVVHCSAGVGRTGTLVALDCLLEQLRATGHAAVFNTVADLRRQRNFLVQSLKQYIFVYRALVEYAHYGDTEIPASRLRSAIDRLRNTPEGADKCLMEHQFEKIINSPIPEPLKSCAAGAAEEVRARNRAADCLPYDRNRVILAPLPNRDFSTYINASFIEAYDNTEGFIITQDPLPGTIMDFWRMVLEHNVSTIVMLSELGEGKCPRYWEDGTAQYEHISVQYEDSESCPYYTRRQFRVTNNKSGEAAAVRQLQYQGWPTAPGHVPEVTRGLAELADAALPTAPAMLVHCQLGVERSALFVALCTLIGQLRGERRLDVCSLVRSLRSQRARTLDTFLQYEFLHRAILNYAELHNLLEDS